MPAKEKKETFKLSQNIREMRAIAITITKKPNITIRYSDKAKTAFYEPEKLRITLTSNCLPKGIDKYPTIHRKLLDGLLGHECYLEGTPILTEKGLIPIEQVRIGDKVLSKGKFVKVLKTFKRHYKGKVITIRAKGILPFASTIEHPIEVVERKVNGTPIWKRTIDIDKKDFLIFPKLKTETKTIVVDFSKDYPLEHHKKRYGLGKITIDNNFSKFLGYYIADGYTDIKRGRNTISLDSLEKALEVKRLSEILFKRGRIDKISNKLYNVQIDSMQLAQFLKENFNLKGHSMKTIPNFMFNLSSENIKSFFKGYWKGDGSYEKSGSLRIKTVSLELALKIQKLLSKIDVMANIHYLNREKTSIIKNRIVNIKPQYAITINSSQIEKLGFKKPQKEFRGKLYGEDKENFYVPIKKIKIEDYSGMVYNLHTENERYEVNNINTLNCGHDVLTLPIWLRYKKFEEKVKYRGLAHFITNIIEDKRVNYFIENRYRFDIGKRLAFLNRIERETTDKALEEQLKTKKAKTTVIGQGKLILGVLVNKGLYNCECKSLWAKMESKTKKDAEKCLKLLETTKYLKVKHDIIVVARKLYSIIEPYVENEEQLGQFIPKIIEGGLLEGEISEELQDEFESEEEREKEAKKQKEDLKRGGGAGKGRGEHIPAPEPDFEHYNELVNRNAEEIRRLLNKLKRTVKPIVKKSQFRRRGRLMTQILAKAYVNSLRRRVHKIYVSTETKFEKQKVAIQILVDFSGSMDKTTAENVITILNEVFGSWLEDKAFSIMVFGENYQKIKTFFETFQQTRARIGGISVDASATECSEPLAEILKMFNEIGDKEVSERDKLLVLASDFWFGDTEDTVEQLKELLKHGVKLLFVGLCNHSKLNEILPNTVGIFRVAVDNLSELPELFIDIYTNAINMNE